MSDSNITTEIAGGRGPRSSISRANSSYSQNMHFDDVIIQLGQFGSYQRRQFFLLCIPGILCAFHQVVAVFLSAEPDFRCALPRAEFNSTDTYAIQNSNHQSLVQKYIPLQDGSTNQTAVYKTCKVLTDSGVEKDCNEWVYSTEDIDETIVTIWNLVCSEKYKSTLSVSMYMLGVLLGAFGFGILSDAIGRKKTYLTCLVLQGASGLATAFSPNYITFVILRLLAGSASMGLFMTAFVLGMELIGPKYRVLGGIVVQCFFALGYVILTGIAYGLKKWNYIQIAISVPSFLFLSYYWIVTESARWLLAKEKTDEAEEIVQKAAKVNGVRLPEKLFEKMSEDAVQEHERFTAVFRAPVLLRRTLIIFFNWTVVAMGYYGLSLNSGTLGGNIYVNFLLGGAIEFPAYIFCLLCNKLGRKWPHVFGMLVGGLACLGSVLIDKFVGADDPNKITYFVVLNTAGKFGMSVGFCVIYIWSAEIFPTGIRNSMMGLSSTWARVGAIAAPVIGDLGDYVPKEYKRILPPSILGSLVVVGGLLSILLPETTGYNLPETVHEANLFPNHEREKKPQLNKAFQIDEAETKFR